MTELASIIESLLFASGEPLPVSRMSLVLEREESEVMNAFEELKNEFESSGHSLKVVRLGDKIQMCSDARYSNYISRIMETRKPPMLSNPALETLAIVAYFQPATVAYVSKIRGVDSSYTISSLLDKGLIEEKGRMDAPGRPILYGTTDAFLRTMGISGIDELPALPDMASNSAMDELKAKIESLQSDSLSTDLNDIEKQSEEVSES